MVNHQHIFSAILDYSSKGVLHFFLPSKDPGISIPWHVCKTLNAQHYSTVNHQHWFRWSSQDLRCFLNPRQTRGRSSMAYEFICKNKYKLRPWLKNILPLHGCNTLIKLLLPNCLTYYNFQKKQNEKNNGSVSSRYGCYIYNISILLFTFYFLSTSMNRDQSCVLVWF